LRGVKPDARSPTLTQGGAQSWSIRNCARQLLGENLSASLFGERVPLQGKFDMTASMRTISPNFGRLI
jgi:hypothetical protein